MAAKDVIVIFGLCVALPRLVCISGCTGITIESIDGQTKVYGRTMEWTAFDLKSRLLVIPRGYVHETEQAYKDMLGDKEGIKWGTKYGIVGIDGVDKIYILDGINEKGLTVGMFYFPGFTFFPEFDEEKANQSIAASDVMTYILGMSKDVNEAIETVKNLHILPVEVPELGMPPPYHLIFTDPTGQKAVVEFAKEGTVVFDATDVGVIANAPQYDWHLTNIRNYINLSPFEIPDKSIGDLNLSRLGAWSGSIGLPGDFTPPSRFVRAVAFSQAARPTEGGMDTIKEAFRILDNFNVPVMAVTDDAEAHGVDVSGLKSGTLWTTAYDVPEKILYYHTMDSRRVRMVDLKKIDFDKLKEVIAKPLDEKREEDIHEILF